MAYNKRLIPMMGLIIALFFSLVLLMVPPTASCQVSCQPPMTFCGGICTNLLTDPNNCGACGNVCSLLNATALCSSGLCWVKFCSFGWGDCDGVVSNGCETNLLTNSKNCGNCFISCQGGTTCNFGQCK